MAEDQKKTPTRTGGRTARNSAKIRAAVLSALKTEGYSGLSFQTVAEAAGVNRTTLYRRWDSRSELVLWALRESSAETVTFEDTGSLIGDLRALLNRLRTFLTSPAGATWMAASLDMIQRDSVQPEMGMPGVENAKQVLLMFERAKARSELPKGYDAEAAFGMLVGSLYFRLIVLAQKPDKAWVERILAMYAKSLNLKMGK